MELLVGSGREEGFTISTVRWFDVGGCDLGGWVFKAMVATIQKESIVLSMGRMSAGIGLSRGKAGYLTLGLIHQLGAIEEGALEAGGTGYQMWKEQGRTVRIGLIDKQAREVNQSNM